VIIVDAGPDDCEVARVVDPPAAGPGLVVVCGDVADGFVLFLLPLVEDVSTVVIAAVGPDDVKALTVGTATLTTLHSQSQVSML